MIKRTKRIDFGIHQLDWSRSVMMIKRTIFSLDPQEFCMISYFYEIREGKK